MSDCQHPRCSNTAGETYRDEHGNTLSLCGRHYYRLVSGESVSSGPSLGATGDATPDIAGGDVMGSRRRPETSTREIGEIDEPSVTGGGGARMQR